MIPINFCYKNIQAVKRIQIRTIKVYLSKNVSNILIHSVELPAAEPRSKEEINEINLPDYEDILKKSFLFFEAQRLFLVCFFFQN